MMPLSDDNRGRRRAPVVTWVLIALNVLVFVYQLTLGEQGLNQFYVDYGIIPREISDGQDLWTLLTSMFLHGGWLHIAGNMLFLWVFGDNVEDVMGHVRYVAFYLLTGVGAGLAQVLANPDSTVPTIGASGAISGLLAAYLVCFPHGRVLTGVFIGFLITTIMLPAWMMIGYWIVLQVISGVASLGPETTATEGGVAWWAHIGGFVAGLVLVWPLRHKDRVEFQRASRDRPDPRARPARMQRG
jgi:membrane associated rhomboid family serine protease